MKYELIPSISAKCRMFTSKVNFVVTIAFRYAFCATYFITQRAEAHLSGATQRTLLYEEGNSELTTNRMQRKHVFYAEVRRTKSKAQRNANLFCKK